MSLDRVAAPVEPVHNHLMTDREEKAPTRNPNRHPNRQHKPFPPLSGETGKAKSPGGDLGAKGYAVELAAARRGVGRQPRM